MSYRDDEEERLNMFAIMCLVLVLTLIGGFGLIFSLILKVCQNG